MVKLGYNIGSKGPDGDFGSKTYAAVIDFQRKHNLDDDGIVGSLTKNAIKEVIKNMEQNITTPEVEEKKTFKVGDTVRLVPGATYVGGGSIASYIFDKKLYIREVRKDGNYIISTLKTGAITGMVAPEAIVDYEGASIVVQPNFEPYLVKITASALNVRAGAGTQYPIITQLRKNGVYTIVGENGKWGKLKTSGWISLDYTKKLDLNNG